MGRGGRRLRRVAAAEAVARVPAVWRGAGIATLLCALACGLPLSGCGGSSDSGGTTASTSTGASGEPTATPVDVHALPVGTDKYVTDGPKKGYVYSCITDFNGGGADVMGPWFSSDGKTYDLTKKVAVEGKVKWDSKFSEKVSGSTRALSGNGLPPDPVRRLPGPGRRPRLPVRPQPQLDLRTTRCRPLCPRTRPGLRTELRRRDHRGREDRASRSSAPSTPADATPSPGRPRTAATPIRR